ncbi:uncharacterized protein LOC126976396 [Leptidea sinapis]|uniref:uncharacterized protein LOC126976396 n=1 Tax=Leptidea sinapis TaxID=189913 RepID=UPI0021C3A984|nr:uncharacterized protein LOC126976396 [Leptidea sinapis]
MNVESHDQKTTLVLRSDSSVAAQTIATAYVLSETGATEKEVKNMEYTALPHTESITEYLITRAVDSPQHYVFKFAYGMDVTSGNDSLTIKVLYSPLHSDHGAAARSLARVYMALIRYYTGSWDSTIQVIDDPLALDLTPWMKFAESPPIFVQFLLILTISHIVLIPSMESGIKRHIQCNTLNFSPLRYWLSMLICDLILYLILICLMMAAIVTIMSLVAPLYFGLEDFMVVFLMLAVYGLGCIPQAYIFSLGPRAALNSMIYIIVNIIFGETTVIAKIFYGNALDYALNFLSFSPQFNMGYALVKIKKTFLYNSECNIFHSKNLCSSKTLHKCCPKCGVLQACFMKKNYLASGSGLRMEIVAMFTIAILFMTLLLIWEYRYVQRFFSLIMSKWMFPKEEQIEAVTHGVAQERMDVMSKKREIKSNNPRTKIRKDTFGEYLLACDVSRVRSGVFYVIRHLSFGIGRGEVLAISGQYYRGRQKLCELVAGYRLPTSGNLWSMSKWSINVGPYMSPDKSEL